MCFWRMCQIQGEEVKVFEPSPISWQKAHGTHAGIKKALLVFPQFTRHFS